MFFIDIWFLAWIRKWFISLARLFGCMEGYYFYYFVLPLGVFVGVLASLVFLYARREEAAQRKLKKVLRTYVKRRRKQEEVLAKELEKLEELRSSESIDEITYERLKHILEMDSKRKRDEARAQLTSIAGKDGSISER